MSIELETFLAMPADDVAQVVKERGPKVIVCPVNGTRRWYYLEHGRDKSRAVGEDYIDKSMQAFIDLFTKFFRLGVHTLLTPALSPKIAARGNEYMVTATNAIVRLANQPSFISFYKELDIRVGFYGDYRRILKDAGHEDVAEELDGIVEATAHHASRRLLFGLFAEDAVNVILNYTADRIEKGENLPSRDEIIAHYYGEFIPPVDIFIGMSRFAAYDMPLLSTGREDLYFLAAPTLYLQEEEIRRILYDHIFARPTADSYEDFEGAGWDFMQTYYAKNRKRIFGIGSQQYGMWYPDI